MSTSFVRRASVFSSALLLLIIVGCVTTAVRPGHAALKQTGELTLASGAEKDIPFPTPYGNKPEIVLDDDSVNNLKIIECTPDHFRVRNDDFGIVHVNWTATGERAAPPAPTPPAPTPALK